MLDIVIEPSLIFILIKFSSENFIFRGEARQNLFIFYPDDQETPNSACILLKHNCMSLTLLES